MRKQGNGYSLIGHCWWECGLLQLLKEGICYSCWHLKYACLLICLPLSGFCPTEIKASAPKLNVFKDVCRALFARGKTQKHSRYPPTWECLQSYGAFPHPTEYHATIIMNDFRLKCTSMRGSHEALLIFKNASYRTTSTMWAYFLRKWHEIQVRILVCVYLHTPALNFSYLSQGRGRVSVRWVLRSG